MNYISSNITALKKSYLYKNQSFPVLEWVITEKCNYNCLHCVYAASHISSAKEWTLTEAERLLDEALQCQIRAVSITGGEPLLHKYFFEIVESICRRNMIVQELHTNGQFISQSTLNCLKEIECRPLINISFDGVNCHDWLRNQEGSQKETLQTIQLCLENGFQVRVLTNLYRHNIASILPTAQLLAEMGVTEMCIVRTTESPRLMQTAKGACLKTEEYFDCMLEFIRQYTKSRHTMAIDINQIIFLLPKQKKYQIVSSEHKNASSLSNTVNCEKFLLTADGSVFPFCPIFDTEKKKNLLGNAKTEGLGPVLERRKNFSRTIPPDCCPSFEKGYYNRLEELLNNWEKLN